MSSIAKKFFIASLIYLILGLLTQVVVVFDVWLGFNPLAFTTVNTTLQILLIGWLTQLGLALTYDRWLLTENSASTCGTAIFLLLNSGLLLVITGQPGIAMWGGNWIGAFAAFGSVLQLVAGFLFLWEVWVFFRR